MESGLYPMMWVGIWCETFFNTKPTDRPRKARELCQPSDFNHATHLHVVALAQNVDVNVEPQQVRC